MNATDLAGRLDGVKNGTGYKARCPAHNDTTPSLSIRDGDGGRLLVHCHAGCTQEAVIEALRRLGHWPEKGGGGYGTPSGKRATVQHPETGLKLEEYAAQKRLPVARLREWGLSDVTINSVPAVRMVYLGESGEIIATRHRGIGEHKHRWKSGDKPALYGLWRLRAARAAGYIVLCEGESDSHTLWHHEIHAAGVPGANTWKEDWAPLLDGIPVIYVVIEPDKGGEAVRAWLGKSAIRERVRLVTLEEAKDPSELYLSDPEQFAERWQAAMDAATPWVDVEAAEAKAKNEAAWAKCSELAKTRDILSAFERSVAAAGVAGEARATKLLYLVTTSRLNDRPVSAVVKGPSSAGKSHTSGKVLSFFPPTAYYTLSGMSEHALAYSEEPLVHRVLVIFEAAGMAGEFASYLMRSLLSEGRVKYETVEKTTEGLRARLIEREGPTGLIVTTTAASLHPENETRMLSIPVNDTQDQTRHILMALADEGDRPEVDLEPWHALQEWLAGGECRVTIPYARELAEAIPPVATRLRRDFGAILGLIRAHALLHRATRDIDGAGRVVATLQDYAAVRDLVADLVADGAGATVAPVVRETVRTAAAALEGGKTELKIAQLAALLKLDKSTTSRRAKVASDAGYLVNLEEKRGRPARLVLGDPLPDDVPILPPADVLYVADRCTVASATEGIPYPPAPQPADLMELVI